MQTQDALAERETSQTALSATSARILDLTLSAKSLAASSTSDSTRRAYTSDLKTFATWCASLELARFPVTPETVALYITHLFESGRKMATIERAMVAIAQVHRKAKEPSPCTHDTVRAVRKGIANTLAKTIGTAPKKKTAVKPDELRAMVKACPDTLRGKRDRAVLLLGFVGAFRRSELASLDVPDVAVVSEGAEVTLRRSKTDQTGKGAVVGIPTGTDLETCPVRALRAWLEVAHITDGPLFRTIDRHGHIGARMSGDAVAQVVKSACVATKVDPTTYAGHSLRSGFATAASRAGKSVAASMRQTRHKSYPIFMEYVQAATVFSDCAASGLL